VEAALGEAEGNPSEEGKSKDRSFRLERSSRNNSKQETLHEKKAQARLWLSQRKVSKERD
jgi:hypothetical protein